MANLDVLRTIKVRAQAEGTDAAEGALNRVRVATKQLSATNEEAALSMVSNERAIRRLRLAHEEGFSATEKLTKVSKDLSIGMAAGRIEAEQAALFYEAEADKVLGLSRAMAVLEKESQAAAQANESLRAKYDMAFAASVKLAKATEEIGRAERDAGLSRELAIVAIQKETQAYNAQITTLERLAQAGKDAAKRSVIGSGSYSPARDRGADVDAFGSEMNKLQAEFDPAFAALQKYDAYLERLDRAHRVGAISLEVMTARLGEASAAYNAEMGRINGVVVAVERLSAAEERNLLIKGKLQAINTVMGSGAYTPARNRQADAEAAFGVGGEQDRIKGKYNGSFVALEAYKQGLKELREDAKLTGMSQDVYAASLERLKGTFNARRVELDYLSKAEREAARAAKEAADTTAAADAKRAASSQQWKALTGAVPVDANANASRALGSLSSTGLPAMSDAAMKERAALLPMAKAEQEYAETVNRSQVALKSKVITEAEHEQVVARAKGTLLNQTNEYNKATAAAERNTKGTGLNAYAWTNLSYQINDVVTSLASGISPMQTLAQQGGQVYQILQSDRGGVAGGLKSVKDAMLGLATPARLVFGGISALAIAAAYSLYRYQSDMANLRVQTGGIGKATGATVGGINALAPAAGDAAGISTRSAREIAGAFAATGEIGVGMYGDLIKVTKDFAKATGQDLPAATKEIAESFASPLAGATALNGKLGFLTRSMYENIRAAEESGQMERARKILLDGVAGATEKAQEKLGLFTRGWEALKKLTSDTVDGVGSSISAAFGLDEAEEKLKRLLNTPRVSENYLFGDNKALDANIAKARAAVDYAKQQGENAYTDKQGLKIGAIVDAANPQQRALEQMEGKAKTIRDEFERLKVSDPFGPAYQTMVGMERAAKQMRTDLESGGAAFADAVRAAEFSKRTVAYAPSAADVAGINERQDNKRLQALRDSAGDNSMELYNKRLDNIELERRILLDTARQKQINTTSAGSGTYAIGVGQAPAWAQPLIQAASEKYGVNADLLASQIKQESRFNPNAVSPVGAQGISQFMPDTARGIGLKNPFDPAESIMAQAKLMRQLLDQYDQNEVRALVGYNASVKVRNKFVNSGDDVSVLPKETQGYIKAIRTPGPGAETLTKEQADTTTQLDLQRKNLEEQKRLGGENGRQLEVNLGVNTKLTEEQKRGVDLTESYRKNVEATVAATVDLARQAKLVTYTKDLEFERQNLGRTPEDAAAYTKARGMFGDTTSEASKFVIQQEQINDNLKLTRDLGKEAFSGFTSDLSKGVGVLDALGNAFTRFADKLLAKASDKAFSALFDGIFGGGTGGMSGGGLGGIFSGIFGGSGGGIDVGTSAWMPKFAGGGVANRASIFGEAGPEAAVPLPDGRRIPVMLSQPANSNGGGVKVTVNNTKSDAVDAQVSEGPDGEVIIDMVDKGLAKKAGMNRSSFQRASGASLRG